MSENDKLEVGDVVRLKSGGPAMTVNRVDSGGQVVCQWFAAGGKPEIMMFPPKALTKIDEDENEILG